MNTADGAYNDLLQDILDNGSVHHNRTGIDTLSVFGRQLRFNLQDGFPLLTGKKVWHKGVFHELLWFLGAVPQEYKSLEKTNIKYLVDNNVNIWNEWPYKAYVETFNKCVADGQIPEPDATPISQEDFVQAIKTDINFAKDWGNLGPVYGEQWTNWKKVAWKEENRQVHDSVHNSYNQIQMAVDTLKNNPDCRRIIVNAWNPGDMDEMLLPPCHYSFQFKSEEMKSLERQYAFIQYAKLHHLELTGMSTETAMEHYNFPKRKLHLIWNQRSVDTFLGLAFNIASYAMLLEMMAQVTGHVASNLIFSGADVHIYSNHMDQVKEQMSREPRELPSVRLNPDVDNIFDFRYIDIEVLNYNPHPAIKASVAV